MDESNCQLGEGVTVETLRTSEVFPAACEFNPDIDARVHCDTPEDFPGSTVEDETAFATGLDTFNLASLVSNSTSGALGTSTNVTNVSSYGVLNFDEHSMNSRNENSSPANEIHKIGAHFISRGPTNSLPRRSSLSEDSRLVKISVPTNSINLIKPNTPFLNKSRNFLNFITEKSTNMMEKALLPQHIALQYSGNDPKGSHHLNATKFGLMQNMVITKLAQTPEPMPQSENLSLNGSAKESSDTWLVAPSKSEEKSISTQDLSLLMKTQSTLTNGEIKLENNQNDEQFLNHQGGRLQSSNEIFQQMREEKLILMERITQLEDQNQRLKDENNTIEDEDKEKTVQRLTTELRVAMIAQEELKKDYAAANRERESMVMKYAVGEKQLIDTQRTNDIADKKLKDLARENELLQNKLKQAIGERIRICGMLDTKCKELAEFQKEVERLKEDLSVKDVKLKWSQTKFKTEMEMQRETQQKLDKAIARINEVKQECDQVRRESQETIRKVQQSEENKAVTLDHQLKEQQARLILERHVTEDKEILRCQLQKEVESLKNQQKVLIEENNSLSLKIQNLETEKVMYESNLSNFKIISDQKQKEMDDLTAKVALLEPLKLQLIHTEQYLASNEMEVERLHLVNQELQTDMDCCRQREVHMLEFTQKLTDKNVRLQSEFTAIETKANQLEIEQGPLRECISELTSKIKLMGESLSVETSKRIEECEILAKHLAEQTQLSQNLSQKLEDSQGENLVLRRKNQGSIKEMTRELQQCRKKLESYEASSPIKSFDQTPITSSTNSLTSGYNPNGIWQSELQSTNGDSQSPYNDLDKNSLIERILKMQRINVRRAEKIDFLEEHTRALVTELQKKSKIIQNYILHENFDAMGSNERERYKVELARHGGIMASVYNHRVSDENMTLELSLEMNQKLQAVLEDALLKNITLKDNIDTLGEEIARLSIPNQ